MEESALVGWVALSPSHLLGVNFTHFSLLLFFIIIFFPFFLLIFISLLLHFLTNVILIVIKKESIIDVFLKEWQEK